MTNRRAIYKLTAKQVEAAGPGRLHDGGGLYLRVNERGGKSWEFRFERSGKRRTMGLGSHPAVSLSAAREAHKAATELASKGLDPINERALQRHKTATALTVEATCTAYLDAQKLRFKTARYPAQLEQRLKAHVFPVIGALPIASIGLNEIKMVLLPLWQTRHATAQKLRAFLESAIDYAIATGARSDESSNPAALKRLRFVLPHGVSEVKHFAALPFTEAPHLYARLQADDSTAAAALRFVMLTAARSADVVGGGRDDAVPLLWQHIDEGEKLWRVPITKNGRPHCVPLSPAAMAILDTMKARRNPRHDCVFPAGAGRGGSVGAATLRRKLAELGLAGRMTVHGGRSQFRTWAGETSDTPKDVIEMALAHAQSSLDAAYHRGSLLAKRRRLMEQWANYLSGEAVSAEVIPLRA